MNFSKIEKRYLKIGVMLLICWMGYGIFQVKQSLPASSEITRPVVHVIKK